ncbi:MAG TPA: hypothetical protein DCZ95_11885 [Verrucomicrobia bacterium]|nr:MAG: hypothetical protein A2X46_13930 [Lentisphaerae bacterium GWF2_57_35]HBA84785.1 hypothetical protein [Verrucomicrobiota bacterium]
MKISMLLSKYLLAATFLLVHLPMVTADDIDDFATEINSAWSSTNDSQIATLINQRLSQDTNDVVALSVKMYYHLWIDGNITNAQLVATHLDAIVQATTNIAIVDVLTEMKAEVDGIPLSESGSFPQDALNQLRHETRGIFPGIQKCVWLAKALFPFE